MKKETENRLDYFSKLDNDVIIRMALMLESPDIISYCKTSKNFNDNVCQNKQFWNQKLKHDYYKTGTQSDLSKLEIFIDTLPEDKVMRGRDERYIDNVENMDGYNMFKFLADERKRYVIFDKITNPGYSLEPYKNLCNQPSENGKCHSCCDESKTGCKYDDKKCNSFFAKAVKNWTDLVKYHILFLQERTPGTPDHPGPWNKETEYIREPLIRIQRSEILTKDSQPGLLVDGEYIQKPYIRIGGSARRIHKILIKLLYPSEDNITLDNSTIKYIQSSMRKVNFKGYENYQKDGIDYVSIMLGIETPLFLDNEITKYIFSNRFFDRIADVVETTI